MSDNLHTIGARQLAQMINNSDVSAAEVFGHFKRRAEQCRTLNAFVHLADDALPPPSMPIKNGALNGVPIAHKDIFCQRNVRSSCASAMLNNYQPPFDAAVIERARAAGMTFLGRTNMDEFAMGSSGEHSVYGATKNPWNLARAPGGSSSGSAAAVAARLTPIATGTDTGGSIRQPAAFCGVTGIKPTYGRISRWGMVAFASSFDQAGVIAPSAEDCALGLNALCGFDERDSTSRLCDDEDMTERLEESLSGLRIGVIDEFFGEGLESQTGALARQALDTLQKIGAKIKTVKLPSVAYAIPAYYVLTCAEASSNLSRYDGVRYGQRVDADDLIGMYEKTRAAGFGAEVKRRILVGTYVLSYGYYDAYYRRAANVRKLIARDFNEAFKDCDLIASPTTPGPAFPLGAIADDEDPVAMYLQDIYTVPVSLAGLPAISMPCGFVDEMPTGIQLIAPPMAESRLLQAAHQYQRHTDFHQRIPPMARAIL